MKLYCCVIWYVTRTINGKGKTNVYIEKLEGIKGVIRIRKSKDRQHNDQKKKDKQRSTKHYTENLRFGSTKP
jgi:hypothetical protein